MATKINLLGKAASIKKYKLKNEARMQMTVADIKDAIETPTFDGKGKVVKIPIEFHARIPTELEPISIMMWVSDRVTKGSATYSNSKMYDFLQRTNKLDAFAKFAAGRSEISTQETINFLKSNLVGVSIIGEITNQKIGTPDEYSCVGKIIELAGASAPASDFSISSKNIMPQKNTNIFI